MWLACAISILSFCSSSKAQEYGDSAFIDWNQILNISVGTPGYSGTTQIDTLAITITNNSNVSITVEYDLNFHTEYISDQSTATGYQLAAEGHEDVSELWITNLPSGYYYIYI